MRQINVAHFQESGVAWVPWRIAQVTQAAEVGISSALFGRSPPQLESYGLPNNVIAANSPAQLPANAHVIHLHHDCVAQRYIKDLRVSHPQVKIVVTVHGEPDRWQIRSDVKLFQVQNYDTPDAYHVVSADLLSDYVDRAPVVELIPNHPARPFKFDDDVVREPRTMYVPFSHCHQYKNCVERDAVSIELMKRGWVVHADNQRQTNDDVIELLRRFSACWVQLQGYAPDLLTQECWSVGCIPIVLAPPKEDRDAAENVFGGIAPWYLFDAPDPAEIAHALETAAETDCVARMQNFMRDCWTPVAVGGRWRSFYDRVCSQKSVAPTG